MQAGDIPYYCRICQRQVEGKTALVEHLRIDHEMLEIVSYASTTMVQEQERDRVAMEFHRQFEHIKKELTGS